MVPPLDIHVVVGQELVHDDMCPWTTVEDIAYYM